MSESVEYAVLVVATMVLGIVLQIAWVFFSRYIEIKLSNRRLDEASLAIGKNAGKPENENDAFNYLKEKFSPDKFENRITDFIGVTIKVISSALSVFITVCYFAMITGRIFNFLDIDPVFLWVPMLFHLALSISCLLFSIITKVIFGRYPAEASRFNKEFLKTIK